MLHFLLAACWTPLLYTYLLYPILVGALSRLRRRRAAGAAGTEPIEAPEVCILIAAYNEEAVIARKLENCLSLEYPPERLRILVVSDGSTDRTVETARAAAAAAGATGRIEVRENPVRRGKTACLNEAIPAIGAGIVVHTDANTRLDPGALRLVVAPLAADPRVGCVVGELVYTNTDEPAVMGGEGLYWRYENFIKEAESRLGSTITANGGIYAIRRELFEPVPEHLISDAVDPLIVLRRGFRVLFERRARAYERAAATLREEFGRKVRIILPGLWAYVWARGLLVPPRPGPALQYFSHKLLRWLSPAFLAGALIVNIPLSARPLYAVLLAGQGVFYATALAGIALAARGRRASGPPGPLGRIAVSAGYFCVTNAAAAVALIRFAAGRRPRMWEKSPSTRAE